MADAGHTHEFRAFKHEDRLYINPARLGARILGSADALLWACAERICRAVLRYSGGLAKLAHRQGSATGAFSSISPQVRPSFVLMDVDGARVRVALLPALLSTLL